MSRLVLDSSDVRAVRTAWAACCRGYRWARRRRRLQCVVLAALQLALVVFGWGLLVEGFRVLLGVR